MTTDNGATAVAETEVTEEPGQVAGDAGEQQVADAAETEEEAQVQEPDFTAEADEYLKTVEDKGSEGDSTPGSTRQRGPDPQQVANAVAIFRANHDTRQKALDSLEADLVDAGMAESIARRFVKEAKDKLNEHHADSLQYAGYEAATNTLSQHWGAIEEGLSKSLSKEEMSSFTAARDKAWEENDGVFAYPDMIAAIRNAGYESGRSKGYKEGAKQGYLDGRKAGETARESSRSGSDIGGTSSSGVPTMVQWNGMTLEAREAARQKDPDIEMKIAQAGR